MRKVSLFGSIFILVALSACNSASQQNATRPPDSSATAAPSSTGNDAELTAVSPFPSVITPLDHTPTPTSTITPAITGPPRATLRPTRTATSYRFPPTVESAPICAGSPPSRLIVQERGRVTNDDPQPLNVRDVPGLTARIVGVLDVNAVFLVIDGPRCAGGFTWFLVRGGNVEGWIAEGEPVAYYVEPYLP